MNCRINRAFIGRLDLGFREPVSQRGILYSEELDYSVAFDSFDRPYRGVVDGHRRRHGVLFFAPVEPYLFQEMRLSHLTREP